MTSSIGKTNRITLYLFLLNRLHKVFRSRIALDLFTNLFLLFFNKLRCFGCVFVVSTKKKLLTLRAKQHLSVLHCCCWALVGCVGWSFAMSPAPLSNKWHVERLTMSWIFYVSQQPEGRHAVRAVGSLVTLQTIVTQCKHVALPLQTLHKHMPASGKQTSEQW